ncbi:MAG: glutathione metabolism protein [Bradymonadales bacterium]|nr:MAG: glutathione metabolism protein [Bradymonadales bacterium]
MPVTTATFLLLLPIYLLLSVAVIRRRRKTRVPLGFGNDAILEKRVSAHSNFAQYAPLALIGILLCELRALPEFLLGAAGLAICLGRLLHAYGLTRQTENFRFRVAGMFLSFLSLGISGFSLLLSFLGLKFLGL